MANNNNKSIMPDWEDVHIKCEDTPVSRGVAVSAPLGRLLLANDFVKVDGHYENDLCRVEFLESGYAVHADGGVMYSHDFNIYWLLGVLTYYNYMPRDYKTV